MLSYYYCLGSFNISSKIQIKIYDKHIRVYICNVSVQFKILQGCLTIIVIFWCITTLSSSNLLNYVTQDFSVSHKVFIGNVSLSYVSLCSISSWCTRVTILSISSRNARFSLPTRCSPKTTTRLSLTTRRSRFSSFSWYSFISLVTPLSPLTI